MSKIKESLDEKVSKLVTFLRATGATAKEIITEVKSSTGLSLATLATLGIFSLAGLPGKADAATYKGFGYRDSSGITVPVPAGTPVRAVRHRGSIGVKDTVMTTTADGVGGKDLGSYLLWSVDFNPIIPSPQGGETLEVCLNPGQDDSASVIYKIPNALNPAINPVILDNVSNSRRPYCVSWKFISIKPDSLSPDSVTFWLNSNPNNKFTSLASPVPADQRNYGAFINLEKLSDSTNWTDVGYADFFSIRDNIRFSTLASFPVARWADTNRLWQDGIRADTILYFWGDSTPVSPDLSILTTSPTGMMDSTDTDTPKVFVKNIGTATADTITTTFKAGTFYTDSKVIYSLNPGDIAQIKFTPKTGWPRGWFPTRCSTSTRLDPTPAVKQDSAFSRVHDVSTQEILAPIGNLDSAVYTPQAIVRNNGNQTENFDARFKIGSVYDDTIKSASLLPDSSITINFDQVTLRGGTYAVQCSTRLSSDMNRSNDKKTGNLTVISPKQSWKKLRDIPLTPSGSLVKEGGWLVTASNSSGKSFVYSAKGNKTGDFYRYDVVKDSWTQMASIPNDPEKGKPPRKGAKGAVSGNNNLIYATIGNNTSGWVEYFTNGDSWKTNIAQVPLGISGKRVKDGTGVVGTPTHVYLLKSKVNPPEFYEYDVHGDSWKTLKNPPSGTNPKYAYEVGMAYDASHNIYVSKAKYNELYRYDIDKDSWTTLKGMPLQNREGRNKRAKEGQSLTFFNGNFYGFKGGNTNEFWQYNIASNAWAQLEDLPLSAVKKRVKGGGSTTAVTDAQGTMIFGQRGNKSNEFYGYGPFSSSFSYSSPIQQPTTGGVQSQTLEQVAESVKPLRTIYNNYYSFSQDTKPTEYKLIGIDGRLRMQGNTSEKSVLLNDLGAGVYIMQTGGTNGVPKRTDKLVIAH